MSGTGGRRRSLLANAIDSIEAAPALTGAPDAAVVGEGGPRDTTYDEAAAPSFLERRGVVFDEIARTVKRPTIRLKPSECSLWPGNARDYAALSYERCASLIESIREEGTNREPVVIRRTPDAEQPYELIVGTRRHFSIAWLHANNHSEIELVARIETLDDEAAFRLADLENREREDVTDLERARNYLHAVDAYYGGVRAKMAERLAIPRQNLHNLLQLAELPPEVVGAFADPGDLKVRHGMRLAPLVKDRAHRDAIIAAAIELTDEQRGLKNAGGPAIAGNIVCERLAASTHAAKPKTSVRIRPALTLASGRTVGEIVSDTKAKGITININPRGAATVEEILEALRPAIEAARFARGR